MARRITKQDRLDDGLNPFVQDTSFGVVALKKKVSVYSFKEGGDLTRTPLERLLDTHFLYDEQEKVAVYRFAKKTIHEILFGLLTSRSRDLFLYILYSIKKDEDYILLSGVKVQEDIGMSKRTLITAIQELVDVEIIKKKSRSVYWVNPHYIFNGNRIDFYKNLNPDNIIVKSVL